jgi:C4-dicarboxylate transporter, DctM subunit
MGVVLIATLAFGLITPPYGLALLMASKFVGVRFSRGLKASMPIHVIFFATIAFTIFFPSVILWLPKHVLAGIGRLLQIADRSGVYLSVMEAVFTR